MATHFYNEEEALVIIKDLINGLYELHKKGIIHRDLKPANILLSKGKYKITDLGFAKILSEFKD